MLLAERIAQSDGQLLAGLLKQADSAIEINEAERMLMSRAFVWTGLLMALTTLGPVQADDWGSSDTNAVRQLAFSTHAKFDNDLRDYRATKFRHVHGVYFDWPSKLGRVHYLCGELNTLNQYGGPTGWIRFVVGDGLVDGRDNLPMIYYDGNDDTISQSQLSMFCDNTMHAVVDRKTDYSPLLYPPPNRSR